MFFVGFKWPLLLSDTCLSRAHGPQCPVHSGYYDSLIMNIHNQYDVDFVRTIALSGIQTWIAQTKD